MLSAKDIVSQRLIRPAAMMALMRRTANFSNVTWLGRVMWQNPLDALTIQQSLVEGDVDLVIELGTYQGGSAYFMASVFDLLGRGNVITVDIDRRHDINHPRIKFLIGSSVDEETKRQIIECIAELQPKHILLILDSDHSAPHVLREMEMYADLVPIGDYMHVQDGVIDELPRLRGRQPGPLAAINRFLASDGRFEVDEERSGRYLLSHSPKGWLRRTG